MKATDHPPELGCAACGAIEPHDCSDAPFWAERAEHLDRQRARRQARQRVEEQPREVQEMSPDDATPPRQGVSRRGAKKPPKRTRRPGPAVRIRVMKRDRFQCTYCGAPGTDAELEIDHIIPIASGGSNHMSNLTTACRRCNSQKGAGKAPRRQRHAAVNAGIVGAYMHTLVDGKISDQGCILDVEGPFAVVQRFGWIIGEQLDVILVPIERLADQEQCRLYRTVDQMDEAYIRERARDGALVGSIEENVRAGQQMRSLLRGREAESCQKR